MGILTNFIERRGKMMEQDYATGQWPMLAQHVAQTTLSGVRISEKIAMNLVVVFACVRLLSETEASLPLFFYKRMKNGKEKWPDHPLYRVLHDMPNPAMTSMQYRQTLMVHLLLWGNHYSQIVRDNGDVIRELWPLDPSGMKVAGTVQDPVYEYTPPGDAGKTVKFTRSEIFHVSGLSFDGLIGYPPLTVMREAVGLGMALEAFGNTFFSNGTNVGGVLEHPKALSPKAHENLRTEVEKFTGVQKANKLLIIEEGMKYQRIGIPPEDAQFLQTRQFQISEIARFFNVPAHMVGDLEHATFSNIEHQYTGFVIYSLRPWLVRIEQEIGRCLLSEKERGKFFAEHQVDGLLRGDSVSRSTALQIRRQNGIITANEWREIENMNPLPGDEGDKILVNSAMLPIDKLGEKQEGGGSDDGQGNKSPADSGDTSTKE